MAPFYRLNRLAIALILFVFSISSHSEDAGHHDTTHHALKKNLLGIFVGITKDVKGDRESTYGIEYERRFSTLFGAGIVYEKTPDAHKGDGATTRVALAFLHPYKGWRLGLGIGDEEIEDHSESLTRVSVGYDFHLGGFSVEPTYAIDVIDSENLHVYGVVLGKAF